MLRITKTIALAVVLAASVFSSLSAQQVTRGPYLQILTSNSVTVRWRTDVATDSTVRFGLTAQSLGTAETIPGSRTEHEVQLTGLSNSTRYFYSVGTSDQPLAGGDAGHTFETAPVAGLASPTRIWVIGDSGTANANAAAVRDRYKERALNERPADLWLMLGDNAYSDGTDSEYQAAVFDMYPEILRQTPLWSTLGNHDGHTASSSTQSGPYFDIFSFPKNGEAGGVGSQTEAYYSFDYGNIHFICLDSYHSSRAVDGAMLQWLEDDLMANDKDWVVAFWHHPPYTKGSHNSDTEGRLIDMRENVLPLLEVWGVDLVLSGHSHSYERSYLIDGHYGLSNTFNGSMQVDAGDGREDGAGAYVKPTGGSEPNEGAVYAVAGSSGKISGGNLNHPAMFVSLNLLGSMILDVYGNRLDAVFLDDSGATADRFTILKGPDNTPPAVVSANADSDNQVNVLYAEPVDPVTAEIAANYQLDNAAAVLSASLAADERTVVLTTSPLTSGRPYTLTINGVADQASNVIDADTEVAFTYVAVFTKSFQNGVAPTTGYAGTRDTYLRQASATANYGADSDLQVDGDDPGGSGNDMVALLAWDLSEIPTNAVVEGVSLTIQVTNASTGAYEIYEVERDWHENAATWNEADAGFGWQVPGAQGGNDRGSAVLGTVAASTTGSRVIALNADGIDLVQDWVSGAKANHGLIVADAAVGDGLDFASRNHATLSSRPKIDVTYSLPASGDTEAPTAPANLTVMGTSETTVSLSWGPATDNVAVVGYKVYRDGTDLVGTPAATNFTDNGLDPDTLYGYHVVAYDAADNDSDPSNGVQATTDPVPQNPTMTVSDIAMQVDPLGKKFRIAAANVTILNGTVPVANATVTGAWSGLVSEPGSGTTDVNGIAVMSSPKVNDNSTGEFHFTVTDVSKAGYDHVAAETEACIAIYPPDGTDDCVPGPHAPANLGASVSGATVSLSWDSAAGAVSYEVYRGTTAGGPYVWIGSTGGTTYDDGGRPDGTYFYVVTAVDGDAVESGYSNEASATVGTAPPATPVVGDVNVVATNKGKNWRGRATVTVVDQSTAAPVAGAVVEGQWTYTPVSGSPEAWIVSATTDPSGAAAAQSPNKKAASGDTFHFVVTGLSLDGNPHDPGPGPLDDTAGVP